MKKTIGDNINYVVEHWLILVSTVTGSVPISAFASLICVTGVFKSFAVAIKICAR